MLRGGDDALGKRLFALGRELLEPLADMLLGEVVVGATAAANEPDQLHGRTFAEGFLEASPGRPEGDYLALGLHPRRGGIPQEVGHEERRVEGDQLSERTLEPPAHLEQRFEGAVGRVRPERSDRRGDERVDHLEILPLAPDHHRDDPVALRGEHPPEF